MSSRSTGPRLQKMGANKKFSHKKLLHKYKHCMPLCPQHCPYNLTPKQYGAKAQAPIPFDTSLKLSPNKTKEIQCIISSILYYAIVLNSTVLMALSLIAIKQTKSITTTMERAKQLPDYLSTNPDATIRFKASDMILNFHLDASYLSEANA